MIFLKHNRVETDHYFYSIPATVLDVFSDISEWYNFQFSFKSSTVTEKAVETNQIETYEELNGLKELIVKWRQAIENDYLQLKNKEKYEITETSLLDWFEKNISILDEFLYELE